MIYSTLAIRCDNIGQNQATHHKPCMTTTPTGPFVEPYLFFNGQCEEALEFYRKALGAEIQMLMRFKDSPDPASCPAGSAEKVMHASFRVGDALLMASDGCHGEKAAFTGFGLSISVSTEAEADRFFAGLLEGGEARMPLAKTFYSPKFGMVADRFGILWMIMVRQ